MHRKADKAALSRCNPGLELKLELIGTSYRNQNCRTYISVTSLWKGNKYFLKHFSPDARNEENFNK